MINIERSNGISTDFNCCKTLIFSRGCHYEIICGILLPLLSKCTSEIIGDPYDFAKLHEIKFWRMICVDN